MTTYKVLLVDDEEEVRNAVVDLIVRFGIEFIVK